jgi:hypothetical protein
VPQRTTLSASLRNYFWRCAFIFKLINYMLFYTYESTL